MATNQYDYDGIIVGARCAGSPTAMLLARKGYKVLVVDKATFPSDTISTHLVHPPGVASCIGGADLCLAPWHARSGIRVRWKSTEESEVPESSSGTWRCSTTSRRS